MSETFKFCLYVAGDTQNSVQALSNLRDFCSTYLPGEKPQIEVVDVFKEPRRALEASIFMTPALIKTSPMPVQKVVGSLGHAPTLLRVFGIGAAPE